MRRVAIGEAVAKYGAHRALRVAHDGMRKSIVILAYHRILPHVHGGIHPYDLGLISTTPEEFDWQMGLLRRDFNPVPLSALGLYLRGRASLPKRAVVVTFDDGYADNFHHAFPILQRHNIPATIFVTAGHMDGREPLWHDLAANIVIRARNAEVPTMAGNMILRPSDTFLERQIAARKLLTFLKSQPHASVQKLVQDMRSKHLPDLRPEDAEGVAMLNWDQIRTMSAGGMEIGSHTMTHAMLSRLQPAELRYELVKSKEVIEQHTQMPCDAIAYPVGRKYAYTEASLIEVGLAGYRIGVAYDAGVNWQGSVSPYELLRQSVESDTSRNYFKSMLTMPKWFQ